MEIATKKKKKQFFTFVDTEGINGTTTKLKQFFFSFKHNLRVVIDTRYSYQLSKASNREILKKIVKIVYVVHLYCKKIISENI